jgi:predicted MFS family arabinose efflux permease
MCHDQDVVDTETQPTPGALRAARVATSAVFAVHGAVMGSFAARLPWIADHVGMGAGGLGVALLMPGIGAILATVVSGRLVHRNELRVLVKTLILLWCAALLLPGICTSLAPLCAALVVFGVAAGLADVAMNAHGVLVEQRYGRSVMSGFHGYWSLGVLLGSGVAALAAGADVDARGHFALVSAVLAAVTVAACPYLIPYRSAPSATTPPALALPTGALLPIGLVGLCSFFAEGAGQDWSAVYLRDELGQPEGTAALAVSTFSLSMAAGRFAGDTVVRRLGPVTAVRLCAACATVGALTVITRWGPHVVIGGFALLGVGVSIVVPLVFAAAGRTGEDPGRSIAAAASISYGSGLVAPGIIGGIAHLSSLRLSFGVVATLTLLMGLGAGALGRGDRDRS